MEDRGVAAFFRVALNVEFIDDIDRERVNVVRVRKNKGEVVRDTPYARHLREALEYLLRERPADSTEWALMTGVSFWEDDRLYAYLQDLCDYFYGDRKEPPVAPDPEAPPPEKYWT
ncbi:hypothetical protein [Streptomyces inhibens]|uniref:hypothetical protein n=1 Tax=Streptomyces inhibens TaxID=2293571 RepID=UPI001EE69F1C|nr:hypothetical protein [Streptomyces inhibens]UKY51645.1 hypothetical protein KI385_24465 [Streptomyces inhibens]